LTTDQKVSGLNPDGVTQKGLEAEVLLTLFLFLNSPWSFRKVTFAVSRFWVIRWQG
jgi:hypothetical protein